MIKSWKHKGLQKFFTTGSTVGIIASHTTRLELLLHALEHAEILDDLRFPSFKLHQLKGNKKEIWSITVSGNWRLTFKFEDGDVYILNYEDYH